MIEPPEAEIANPPIFSESDERTLRNEAIEQPHLREKGEKARQTDLENGLPDVKLVTFAAGSGEDPREWSKTRKWLITITASMMCLSVALGSALPTGECVCYVLRSSRSPNIGPEICSEADSCVPLLFGLS